jgi:DNA-binding SARP family transcriptional activator
MLTIRLLGELEVSRGTETLVLPPSRRTRALLGYLVATRRPHRRERLCSLLWGIPDDPRGALRWSLSKLRALLDEPGAPRLVADRESVAFVGRGDEVDLDALRDLTAAGAPPDPVTTERLRMVADAARGDFLEGLDLPGQADFQAWCVAEREEARRRHAAVLSALVARLAAVPDEALPHARRAVQLEPFDERARVALVGLLARAGRRGEAEQHCEAGCDCCARRACLPPRSRG